MTKRFASVYDPGDAAITARFPVVAADIATDAVTTIKIANDAVTSPKAATGVVDGDTITNAVIQTSASGQRLVMDGPSDIISAYSGVASEVLPTTVDPAPNGTSPSLDIKSGTTTTQPEQARLRIYSGAAGGGSSALLFGGVATLNGTTQALVDAGGTSITVSSTGAALSSDLAVAGHATFTGTGWQNVSFAATWSNFGSTFQTGQYKRVGNRVTLRGTVTSSAPASPSNIFTLPVGYRVSTNKDRIFPAIGNGGIAAVNVASSGVVRFDAGNATFLCLDGIEFDID